MQEHEKMKNKKEHKTIKVRITRYLPFVKQERSWIDDEGEQHWYVPFLVYDDGKEISLKEYEGEIPEDVIVEGVDDVWWDILNEIAEITGHTVEEVERWGWDPGYDTTDVFYNGNSALYTYDFFFEIPEEEIKKLEQENYDFQITDW